METRFDGEVAVVTGAAGGIGAATARRLADDGAAVVVLDRDADGAEQTAAALRAGGAHASAVGADVADATQVETAFARVLDAHGRLDMLVNNAGVTRDDLLFRLAEEDWDTVVDVSLKGTFLCARAAQAPMVEARAGRIVNLSSRSALGNRGQANYAAAKAGVRGLTATLALELGPFGIRVNAVAPGYVTTAMTAATARRLGLDPEEHRRRVAEQVPLRRVAEPEDVAGVIAFLLGPDARHVTGQTIEVNGGLR